MKMLSLVPLLMRSAGFRGIIIWVTLGAAIGALGLFSSRAFVLSPEQQAEEFLGGAAGLIEPFTEEEPTAAAGIYPEATQWSTEPDIETVYYSTQLPLRAGDGFIDVRLYELSMPAVHLEGSVELQDGTWPQRSGECLVQSLETAPQPPLGNWPLQIVGRLREVYHQPSPTMWCAPGTWGMWKPGPGGVRADASLGTSYYVVSDTAKASSFVQQLIDRQEISPSDVIMRSVFLDGSLASAQSFLGVTSIAVALLLGLSFVLSSITGTWIRHVQKAMSLAGVPPKLWFRAGVVTLVVVNICCAIVGTVLGTLLSWAARPLLRSIKDGLPLSPISMDVGWVGISALLAGVGALAGFSLTAWSAHLRMRASTAVTRPLSPRGMRVYGIVAAICLILSAITIALSGGRRWDMVIGVLLGIAAAAAVSPLLLMFLAKRMGRSPTGPVTLAARLLHADGRRWASNLVATTVLVGLVLSVLVNVSASAAAQTALLRSPIPRGFVVVEMPDHKEDKQILDQMLTDTKSPEPVVALRSRLVVSGEGNVVMFSSVADAQTVLGPLPIELRQALESGAIIKPAATSSTVVADYEGTTRELRVVGFRQEASRYIALGYGYALTASFPDIEPERELLVLHDLSEDQAAALRQWPQEQGTSALVMHYYYEPTTAMFALWLTIGFSLLAVLMGPVLFGLIRREVNQLKPLARDLDSLGIPRSWIRNALRTLTVVVIAVPVVLAVITAGLTTATLEWFYPPIFDTAQANWPGVGFFSLGLLVAAVLAAHLGSRNVRKTAKTYVI